MFSYWLLCTAFAYPRALAKPFGSAQSTFRMDWSAHSNANSLWGAFLASALARMGLKQAVVSPGSRSTPIALGLAACEQIESFVILDERSAGFFALGLARSSRQPVLLVCTSGSAAANYLPALVEASESGTPLLVLTADRPQELRRCAAGQAIDQTRMYGSFARDFFELPCPEPTSACLRQLRQTMRHALMRCMAPERGPVHVNCPFREPLAPQPQERLKLDFDPAALLEGMGPVAVGPALPDFSAISLPGEVRRGLIVAGTLMADDDAAARHSLMTLAARSGWPVLCDALGPWRAGDLPEGVVRVDSYAAILKDRETADALRPDFVLQVGPLPTSKALRQWLELLDLPTLVVSPGFANIDPLHASASQVQLVPELVHLLPLPRGADAAYAASWAEANRRCRAALDAALDTAPGIDEGAVARELFRSLAADGRLFVANSMSVRHAELYAASGHAPFRVFFSRGANGIDGTLASALGMAQGGRGVLLCGDLALLHDAASLLCATQLRGVLDVVLVDNGGGGIFRHLPVARVADGAAFERFFLTPQKVDFALLAAAYGAGYVAVKSLSQLRELITGPMKDGLRILHLRTT